MLEPFSPYKNQEEYFSEYRQLMFTPEMVGVREPGKAGKAMMFGLYPCIKQQGIGP